MSNCLCQTKVICLNFYSRFPIPDSRFPIPDYSQLQRSLIQSHRSEFQP
ncbi:hypothetical protein [Moorena sp. SIO2C4]|nr:hypothetical protein [Moorena sp. SIO2C4]NES40507.1 hypothetical protein [Moorena sp. SIO2C4]